MRHGHHRCVGCVPRGRPRSVKGQLLLHFRWRNRRRGTRRRGASAACERRGSARWPMHSCGARCEGARPPDRSPGQDEARAVVPGDVQARSAGAAARVRRPVCRDRRSSRSTRAQHDAKADDATADRRVGRAGGRSAQSERSGASGVERTGDHDRRQCRRQACEARCRGRRAERRHERGAKRARGRCRRATDVCTRKRAAPPSPVAGDDDAARDVLRVRRRSGAPGCRAASPCRRGSR